MTPDSRVKTLDTSFERREGRVKTLDPSFERPEGRVTTLVSYTKRLGSYVETRDTRSETPNSRDQSLDM